MAQTLKPYPAYKDSGVPWVEKVPAHWKLRSIDSLAVPISLRGRPELPLLSVLRERGVVIRSTLGKDENRNFIPDDLSNYRVVRKGNLVINKMKSWQGSLGVSAHDGIVSPAYFVYDLHVNDGRFLHCLLRSKPYVHLFAQASDGIRIGQWDLSVARMKRIGVPIPPDGEQDTIVRFLAHADRHINRFIRAKRRLVGLLNEQKQAIIHRAVTRGLDPDVRLKPSGIDWLGDVPEHWEATRLKYVAKVQTGVTLGKTYGSAVLESRPYLRVANVQDGYLDLKDIATVNVPTSEAAGCELQVGDVLMTEGGDIDKLGRGYIWRGEIRRCLHQNHIFAVRSQRRVLLPDYLSLLMTSFHGRSYFQLTAKQTTNLASTNTTTLRAFPFFLPSVHEQERLLDNVSKDSDSLDTTISRSLMKINLIREYRTRLVADVVTGKLDVRAVELPALGEEEVLEDWDEGTGEEADEVAETQEIALADV